MREEREEGPNFGRQDYRGPLAGGLCGPVVGPARCPSARGTLC